MIGADLEDLGKGLRSQVGTLYGTLAKGPRYLEMAEGYLYSPETVAIQIIRRLRHMVQVLHIKGDILIEAHPDVLALLKDKKRKAEWERELKRTLYFEESHHPNREVFSILSYEP